MKSWKFSLFCLAILLTGSGFLLSCSTPPVDPEDDCDDYCGSHCSDYLPITTPIPLDTVKRSYRGTLVVGEDVQSFHPDGSTQEFWVTADESPQVRAYFERILRSDAASETYYKPRRITLNGYFQPKLKNGLAAQYDGLFIATGMY